jgi:seryl-tRNA(Sec) selenium transferase
VKTSQRRIKECLAASFQLAAGGNRRTHRMRASAAIFCVTKRRSEKTWLVGNHRGWHALNAPVTARRAERRK